MATGLRAAFGIAAGTFALAAAVAACRFTEDLAGGLDEACGADLQTSITNCGACGRVCEIGPNGFAACVNGQCRTMCTPGFSDCDDSGANGCEVYVMDSGTSCGRCGHDCLGGACQSGVCQRIVLAQGGATPVDIAVDDASVYGVTPYGAIVQIPKSGGDASVLVRGFDPAQDPPPRMTLSGDVIYWTSSRSPDGGPGAVQSISTDGGGRRLISTANEPYAISALGANLFWSEGVPPPILAASAPMVPDASRPPTIIRVAQSPSFRPTFIADAGPAAIYSIAADQNGVTWANTGAYSESHRGTVERYDIPSHKVDALISGDDNLTPFGLVTTSTMAYFTTGRPGSATRDFLLSCAFNGCVQNPDFLSYPYDPRFVTITNNTLFWTNGDGTIRAYVLGNRAESTLYKSSDLSLWDIAVDSNAIYWTSYRGTSTNPNVSLYKLARP